MAAHARPVRKRVKLRSVNEKRFPFWAHPRVDCLSSVHKIAHTSLSIHLAHVICSWLEVDRAFSRREWADFLLLVSVANGVTPLRHGFSVNWMLLRGHIQGQAES